MKTIQYTLVWAMAFFCAVASAQNLDSLAAVKRVDSLVNVAAKLRQAKKYPEALATAEQAVTLAYDKLGTRHLYYANALNIKGRVYYFMEEYEKSVLNYTKALESLESAGKKESMIYAKIINNLALAYEELGEFPKAEQAFLESKRLRGNLVTKTSQEYFDILQNLGFFYGQKTREYEKGETVLKEGVDIREKAVGKDHIDYANALYDLALFYRDSYQKEKAIAIFLEVKSIRARLLGKQHTDYIRTCVNLGNLFVNFNELHQAIKEFEEVKVLLEANGNAHSDYYARSVLGNLGNCYMIMGDFEQARQHYLKALEIVISISGQESESSAMIMLMLATLYNQMGLWKEAESGFLQAIPILKKSPSRPVETISTAITNLGNLYLMWGKPKEADDYLRQSLTLQISEHQENTSPFAKTMGSLGIINLNLGLYEKSEKYLLQSLAINKKLFGDTSINVASDHNNLCCLYRKMQQYSRALIENQKDLLIEAQLFGTNHPAYAMALNNRGAILFDMEQYDSAEDCYLQAKEIRRKTLGTNHPFYGTVMNNLGALYYILKRYDESQTCFMASYSIIQHNLNEFDEEDCSLLLSIANLYEKTNRPQLAIPYYLKLHQYAVGFTNMAADFLSEEEMLNNQQLFQAKVAAFYSFVQRHPNSGLAPTVFDNTLFYKGMLLENVRTLENAVASTQDSLILDRHLRWKTYKSMANLENQKPAAERDSIRLAQWAEQANNLEKELIRTLPGFSAGTQTVSWQQVRSALHPGEAAIEFINYDYYSPDRSDSIIYAALVLLPGDTSPHFIPLCEQQSLDDLLNKKYQDQRYASQNGSPSLYRLIWQPLQSLLRGVHTIYYAPSGKLHQLNPDAITWSENSDSTLIDRYKLVRLGSTRQLLSPHETKIVGHEAILFGGIRYESDSTAIQTENQHNGIVMRGAKKEAQLTPIDSIQALDPLPETLTEVQFIEKRLKQQSLTVRRFTGFGASEEAFKYCVATGKASPKIIHIATHGFANPLDKVEPRDRDFAGSLPFYKTATHPFLRSGLFFAGCNHARATGKPLRAGMEDGILTAYEVSELSLQNTELVVLSACETGLGDLSGNEGVYGLQRAFKIAGAQYIIMSLWSVPDQATKDLMSLFYTNWLDKKMTLPAAFRSAQLSMKKRYKDPEMWAGFVLVQ